ncbi:MAG: hypothetical protein P4L77_11240 [Sulfuriferula sp.]|nr:hypothetical protein [Sulfuriferula sp.]
MNDEVIARINAALGLRKVDCMGIATGGAGHAAQREASNEEKDHDLFGIIWVNEEQRQLAKENDFAWFVDILPVHEGRLEDRPADVQKLPAKLTIYSHDPSLLFDSLLGALFAKWNEEKRFKTAQKWHSPGIYKKPKKT